MWWPIEDDPTLPKKKKTLSQAELNNETLFIHYWLVFITGWMSAGAGRGKHYAAVCLLSNGDEEPLNELFSLLWFCGLRLPCICRLQAACVSEPHLLCASAFCCHFFGAWLLSQPDAALSFGTACGEIQQKRKVNEVYLLQAAATRVHSGRTDCEGSTSTTLRKVSFFSEKHFHATWRILFTVCFFCIFSLLKSKFTLCLIWHVSLSSISEQRWNQQEFPSTIKSKIPALTCSYVLFIWKELRQTAAATWRTLCVIKPNNYRVRHETIWK